MTDVTLGEVSRSLGRLWKKVEQLSERVRRLELMVAVAAGLGTAAGSAAGTAISRLMGGG